MNLAVTALTAQRNLMALAEEIEADSLASKLRAIAESLNAALDAEAEGLPTPRLVTVTPVERHTLAHPATFYCQDCQRWTGSHPDEGIPTCVVCGEPYKCGECGYDIDLSGACQRPVEDPAHHDEVSS